MDPPPLVVVTGFMGTGKTETARALADILGLEFIDSDHLIESRQGMTVAEIFETRGEPYFRALEEEICNELAERTGLVVATGGGTLISEKNYQALSRKGTVVLLEASVAAILERVKRDRARPLLFGEQSGNTDASAAADARHLPDDSTPRDDGSSPDGASSPDSGSSPDSSRPAATRDPDLKSRIVEILKARETAYRRIGARIDTTELQPQEAACRIAASLELPFRTLTIPAPTRIETGRGLLSKLGERLHSAGLHARLFLIMPANIREIFRGQISASLDSAAIPWQEIPARDGDPDKTLPQAGEIIDRLAAQGAVRDAVVVAVGGGVTGDLAGFVASIYMRGIALVHVPTTLLAQVDASIGGKVGVNHPRAKNLIGSFYQPHLVLSDPCTLRTLPDREISNGMAEVVKTAIIGSPALFDFLDQELSTSPRRKLRKPEFLERCVAECAAVKSAIVTRDPFERDERRVLNLGHTLGHALESVKAYALTHGEGVSIGLVAALRIAVERGVARADLLERTRRILAQCGLPIAAPAFDETALVAGLHLDKKRRSGRLHFVLPIRPGMVEVVDDVSETEMLAALRKGM
jgi:3-dehydroquinate synthase